MMTRLSIFALLLAASLATAQQYTQDEQQNISVYEQCSPAVVNITTKVMALDWFLTPVVQESDSGSGSIIDKRGYVLTNRHVIAGANTITITLSDGAQYDGKLVGEDATSDIAVLKFDPKRGASLPTIAYGDSSRLKVGQKVLAIGNPFGFERTLTTGIISALGRPIKESRNTIINGAIQTDAPINPGNSGGPLLDTSGRMIGMNTMIYSTSGSSAGIGFAIPVATIKRVVADLIDYGSVRRGVINGVLVQLTPPIVRYAKLKVSQGMLVSELPSGSPAARAGLKAGTEQVQYGSGRNARIIYLGGDIITGIDGSPVRSLAEYYAALESHRPGDKVELTIWRDGRERKLTVTLEDKNED
jgi:S1-C subfamily serine protease